MGVRMPTKGALPGHGRRSRPPCFSGIPAAATMGNVMADTLQQFAGCVGAWCSPPAGTGSLGRAKAPCCRRRLYDHLGKIILSLLLLLEFPGPPGEYQFREAASCKPVPGRRHPRFAVREIFHRCLASLSQQYRHCHISTRLAFAKISVSSQPQASSVGTSLGQTACHGNTFFLFRPNHFAPNSRRHARATRLPPRSPLTAPQNTFPCQASSPAPHLHRFPSQLAASAPAPHSAAQYALRKDGNVFFWCPQRGQHHRHHPQPVNKDLAKFSVANRQRHNSRCVSL